MEHLYQTPLNGTIAICHAFHSNMELQCDASLYKIIWMQCGELVLGVDHIEMTLGSNEIVSLTPLQHHEIKSVEGEYITLLFNSNFYCIYGHDNEVSCNGLLFHGVSELSLDNLPELIKLKYGTVSDAVKQMGVINSINQSFVNSQSLLYAV